MNNKILILGALILILLSSNVFATFIGKGARKIDCNIEKSGKEVVLDIWCEQINNTAFDVVVNPLSIVAYNDSLKYEGKDVKKVPTLKIKGDFDLKEELDLEIENRFTIDMGEQINVSLRIGWSSVQIDGSANTLATRNSNSPNICRTPDGVTHVAYQGPSNNAKYANSTTNGSTWNNPIIFETINQPDHINILCYSNNSIEIFAGYSGNEDFYRYYSDNYSSFYTHDSTQDMEELACAQDSNGCYHCCGTDADKLYYKNCTGSFETVNDNTLDDTDYCDIIAFDYGGHTRVIIAGMGQQQDDLDVWDSDVGWGDGNRIQWDSSMGSVAYGAIPSITYDSGYIYVTAPDTQDLAIFRAHEDSIGSVSKQTLDTSSSHHPAIMVNADNIEILYQSASTVSGTTRLYRANSTDWSISFDIRQELFVGAGFPSIMNSIYPNEQKTQGVLEYVYTDSGSDVNYDNLTTFLYQCETNYTNTSWTAWVNITACNISDSIQKSRNRTQYDANDCKSSTNTTFFDFGEDDCDYCTPLINNTGFVFDTNISCMLNDTVNQSFINISFDQNNCYGITGLSADNYTNITTYDYRYTEPCDNCTPQQEWNPYYFNYTVGCLINDTNNDSYARFDHDLFECFSQTGLASDIWTNSTEEIFIYNETCDYCLPELINSSLQFNQTLTCLINDTKNDSYFKYTIDDNFCFETTGLSNDTFTNFTYTFFYQNDSCDNCTPIAINTSAVLDIDYGCMLNDTRNQTYSWHSYDSLGCFDITGLQDDNYTNETFYEFIYNVSCDNCTPAQEWNEWYFNYTVGCLINDTRNDSWARFDHDLNECFSITGLANDTWTNSTEEQFIYNETCDYCTPNLINSSLIFNQTLSCLINDTKNDTYFQYTIDNNFCFEATGLTNDTFTNFTYTFFYQNDSCDNCSPLPINTSWQYDLNISCLINNTQNHSYTRHSYDSLGCYDITGLQDDNYTNVTYTKYVYNNTCDNCTPSQAWNPYQFNYTVECLINNTKNDSYARWDYDQNYCYSLTGLPSDIWTNSTEEIFIQNDTCDYCTPVQEWNEWYFNYTITCMLNNTRNDSYARWDHDLNECYSITGLPSDIWTNSTEEQFIYNETCDNCTPDLINSSLVFNATLACMINNTQNDTYFTYTIDNNFCYEQTGLPSDQFTNTTYPYFVYNVTCDNCTPLIVNTTETILSNNSCEINNTQNITWTWNDYDSNGCFDITGLPSDDYTNVTYTEDRYEDYCDNCSYIPTNTSWTDWVNVSSCYSNSTIAQQRQRVEYDSNKALCYDITGLPSDLWSNVTHYAYQDVACTYIPPPPPTTPCRIFQVGNYSDWSLPFFRVHCNGTSQFSEDVAFEDGIILGGERRTTWTTEYNDSLVRQSIIDNVSSLPSSATNVSGLINVSVTKVGNNVSLNFYRIP